MARIRTEREVRCERRLRQPLPMRVAATAALVSGFLITYDLFSRHQSGSGRPRSSTSSIPEIFSPDPGAPENRDEVLMMVAEQNHGKR